MIDFDIIIEEPKPKKNKTWFNVNDVKESDIKPYVKGYNPLNPFREGDKVILSVDEDRFRLIEGLTPSMEANVSELLGNNMLNIAYWDTKPSVIKNVKITSLILAKNNKLKVKIRYLFINLLRKFMNPNKFPKRLESQLKQYW